MTATATTGPCVLIVEDEMQLAMLLEDLLSEAGCRVIKAARLPAALQLVESESESEPAVIDAAILDINLAGKQVFPVADALHRRDIPFLFTSGYGEDGLPDRYRSWPMLQKPYGVERLQQALTKLLGDKVGTIGLTSKQ